MFGRPCYITHSGPRRPKSGLLGREHSESGREYLGYSNGVHFKIAACGVGCSSIVRRGLFVIVSPVAETHALCSLVIAG